MIEDFLPARARKPELIPTAITTDDENYDMIEYTEPAFQPPEAYSMMSTSDEKPVKSKSFEPFSESDDNKEKPKKQFRWPFKKPNLTKKQWIIVGCVSTIILVIVGLLVWKVILKPKPVVKTEPVVQKKVEPPKPTTIASPLTGIQVSPELAKLPVTAVMIENSPDARPQAGIKDAGVVYEAVAEGGITRFLTLFQETKPDYIGPIRSVRPYYLDWLVPFDAPVAHVGGSPEAIAQIREQGIKDLDYSYNSGSYRRVDNRYAPHNVYTSRTDLLTLQTNKGFNSSTFTGWARKQEKPVATPTAKAIDFAISGFLYNPHFDYDATTNSYKRSQNGKPHLDEKSAAQISPKVVIAIIVTKSIHPDGVHTTYATHGSGKAYFFQDGIVTEGIWEKTDRKSAMRFGDVNGSPFALNQGNTWITALGEAGSVTYTP